MAISNIDLQKIRSERDRYVAFAFAAADVLIELDDARCVVFIEGAARALCGDTAEALIGTSFDALLAPADRPVMAALGAALAKGGRFLPFPVGLARPDAPPTILGGCRLPDRPGASFFTLTIHNRAEPIAAASKLVEKKTLADAIEASLADPSKDLHLTLVALDGMDALRERLTEEVAEGLNAAIGRYLQAGAASVESASELAPGRYGLLHGGRFETERFEQGVQTMARALDPKGEGVKIVTDTLALSQLGVNGPDIGRALAYCIDRFAEANIEDLSSAALRGELGKPLAHASARVAELRSALDQQRFDLVFQPIVDLRNSQIHHAEALVRFTAGESPTSTVAFAEAVRLIADLDLAVCARVLEILAKAPRDQAPIAVNLSGRSLESEPFAAALFELLKPHRGLAGRLLIEITESAAIRNFEAVNRIVQDLRRQGFRVCLDDFGAGSNSLHYLRAFQVDFVKIDGAFVRSAANDARDSSLLRHIAAFCRETNVATIGEMIEDAAEADRMRAIGIDFAQGYFFGRPGAAPVMTAAPAAPKPMTRIGKRRGVVESWG
jgi:EAL domain-containing protein (putative c-di-GMP-specific phosphodiesterase class I)